MSEPTFDFEFKRGWTFINKKGIRRTLIDFNTLENEAVYCNNDRRTAFTFVRCSLKGFIKWIDARKTARLHARVRAELQLKQVVEVFSK